MNRKLIHWATLTGKNDYCNNNRLTVMMPRRTVAAAFSVAILYEEVINDFLKVCNSLSSYFVTGCVFGNRFLPKGKT